MPREESRRRRSGQRNLLYREPSSWGIAVALLAVAIFIAVGLAVFFG